MSTLNPSGPTLPLDPSFLSPLFTALASDLIGLVLATLLCGIAISQAYHYMNDYTDDSRATKLTVWLITLMNIAHTIFVCAACYHYLVSGAIDTNIIDRFSGHWSIPALLAMHLAIAVPVLFYFTYTCSCLLPDRRVKILVTVILAAPILAHLGFGINLVVLSSKASVLLQAAQSGVNDGGNTSTIPMLATQVAADIFVSIALCLALPKPTSGYTRTRGVIQRMMIYSISRGIITAIAALFEVLAIVISPHSMWFTGAEFIIPSIYANSFLSALNSRKHLRMRLQGGGNTTHAPPSMISVLAFNRPSDTNDRIRTGPAGSHDTSESGDTDGQTQTHVYVISKKAVGV